MNEDIMTLSNKVIYDDKLKCGTPEVAKQALVLPDRMWLDRVHKTCGGATNCWIEKIMEERFAVSVVIHP